jgi:hypothetical protein
MDLGSLFIILSLLIGVGIFVSQPFFDKEKSELISYSDPREHEISELMAERDRVLNAIQELDFDFTLGKIPADDYPDQRALLMTHGAQVLRSLDQLQGSSISEITGETLERQESGVAGQQMSASLPVPPQGVIANSSHEKLSYDDELENILANRRREREGRSAGFCPQCGKPIQKVDQFCPKCGVKLA